MADEQMGMLERRIRDAGEYEFKERVREAVRQVTALSGFLKLDTVFAEPAGAMNGLMLLDPDNKAVTPRDIGIQKVAYNMAWLLRQLEGDLYEAGRREAGDRAVVDFVNKVERLRGEVDSLHEAVADLEDGA